MDSASVSKGLLLYAAADAWFTLRCFNYLNEVAAPSSELFARPANAPPADSPAAGSSSGDELAAAGKSPAATHTGTAEHIYMQGSVAS
jgi:hypothetical protein